MLRFYRFCCLALLFLGLPAVAQANAPAPVEWSLQLQGDVLTLDAKTKATQAPAQRANVTPAFLEVSFPKAKLTGAAFSKAIDRGLVQKVQTLQDGENVLLRVYFLNKPKANLAKTASGYRYTVRMSEPATAPSTAAKPATPTAAKPATTPSAAARPATEQPPTAAKTPAQTESTSTASTPLIQTTAPAAGSDPRAIISVVFQDKPLAEAIAEMASKAGFTPQLDPKLSGVVNLSLSEVPFEEALAALLQPYGDSVSATVSGSTITVSKTSSASAPTTSANPNSGPVVLEYYPFSTKDARKMMEAAMKAIPELSYRVDPVLNILLVQGPREEVVRLGELLKPMFNK
jgi:type II secretory pathway component GspD/PulD (secretin)